MTHGDGPEKREAQEPDRETIEPEPAWDVARLFPPQGQWSEEDYFALDTNRLVEFSDGFIEVLPMPTMTHQLILVFLLDSIKAFAAMSTPKLGTALFAGLPGPSLEKQIPRARHHIHAGRARVTDWQRVLGRG